MSEEPKKLTFGSIDAALSYLDTFGRDTSARIEGYRQGVEELTGHHPDRPVTPLDVIKIIRKVFPWIAQPSPSEQPPSSASPSEPTSPPPSSGFSPEEAPDPASGPLRLHRLEGGNAPPVDENRSP